MASNILKPIGFILILGAVAAGAYYLGQSSKPAGKPGGPGPSARSNGAQPSTQPSLAQRVGDWVSGGQATAPEAPADPSTPATTADPKPVAAKPPVAKPPAAAAAPWVADAVPTRVTALSGDLVLTAAKAKVRLLGVKAPDSGNDAIRAKDALAQLLGDGAVKIQLTADHAAAVVWKDGRRLNESMVRLGWSRSELYPIAEAEAKRNRDGLWSPEGWMGP